MIRAFPCPRRRSATPHHLVVGRRLLHRVNVACSGTLDLKLHGHLRIVVPRTHFFPDAIHSRRLRVERFSVSPSHLRLGQFDVPEPALVKLGVSVLLERVVGIMRFVCRPNVPRIRGAAVQELNPNRVIHVRPVRGLRNVLGRCPKGQRHHPCAHGASHPNKHDSHFGVKKRHHARVIHLPVAYATGRYPNASVTVNQMGVPS